MLAGHSHPHETLLHSLLSLLVQRKMSLIIAMLWKAEMLVVLLAGMMALYSVDCSVVSLAGYLAGESAGELAGC